MIVFIGTLQYVQYLKWFVINVLLRVKRVDMTWIQKLLLCTLNIKSLLAVVALKIYPKLIAFYLFYKIDFYNYSFYKMPQPTKKELHQTIFATVIIAALSLYWAIYTLHHYQYYHHITEHTYNIMNSYVSEFDAPYFKYYCLAQLDNTDYCYILKNVSLYDTAYVSCDVNETGVICDHNNGYCEPCQPKRFDYASVSYQAQICISMSIFIVMCMMIIQGSCDLYMKRYSDIALPVQS